MKRLIDITKAKRDEAISALLLEDIPVHFPDLAPEAAAPADEAPAAAVAAAASMADEPLPAGLPPLQLPGFNGLTDGDAPNLPELDVLANLPAVGDA